MVKAACYLKRPDPSRPRPHASLGGPWDVPALCTAYNFPTNAPGGGVIGIVELGGGWNSADVSQFCTSNKIPVPTITDVSVDGTKNTPGSDADGEVALDIQVAATAYSVATGGKAADIRMYWSQDIGTAVEAATKDGCDVISISWGADEANWGSANAATMEAAAAAAVAAGLIVFAAAGDNDSSDGGSTPANVDLPAGCPSVVGCGGTNKTMTSETVWNNNPGNPDGSGTGGGYSTLFPVQTWQIGAPTAPKGLGRMVPDVAANADPNTGYNIVLNGTVEPVGGTSAVAPLYAGLFAALGTKLGASGSVLQKLWANQKAFSDITVGNNGLYSSAVGPDPCTGIGSPIGTSIEVLMAGTTPVPTPPAPPIPPAPAPVPTGVTLIEAQDAVKSALAAGAVLQTRHEAETRALAALAALKGWAVS